MWSFKHHRKAIKMSRQIRGLKGMAQEFSASYEVVVVEFDPICQQFVHWRFPQAANGWSSDVLDWADPEFQPENWGESILGWTGCCWVSMSGSVVSA